MDISKKRFMIKTSVAALAMAFALPAFADSETEELKALIQALQKKVEAIDSRTTAPAWAGAPITNTPGVFKFYGNIDTGVEMVTNVPIASNSATKNTVARIPSKTGTSPSAIGIDLSKDVGGGIKAVGKAEMGLDYDSGTSGQGPRLFGRQFYAGIESAKLGTLTFGRQYSMMLYGLMAGDLLGPNIYGLGAIDAWVPNARTDNSIAWRNKFDQVSVGLLYSFGRETINGSVPGSGICAGEDPASVAACTSWSAMARYDDKDKRFAIAGAVDVQKGGNTGANTSTANFFNNAASGALNLTTSSDTDTRSTITGSYAVNKQLKLGAGWLNREAKSGATKVKQDTSWIHADYSLDKWAFAGGYFTVKNKDQNTKADYIVLRAIYKFDDQLSAYATMGSMNNSDTSGYGVSGGGGFLVNGAGAPVSLTRGTDQVGTMAGIRYRF